MEPIKVERETKKKVAFQLNDQTPNFELSKKPKNNQNQVKQTSSDCSSIDVTKEQIRILQDRIERLSRLKDALIQMDEHESMTKSPAINMINDNEPNECSESEEQKIELADGSIYCCYANGVQKRFYPNGDVEIRTKTYVKRKFVCGKVKTIYSNGLQETLYNDGRLLFKDCHGFVINIDKH